MMFILKAVLYGLEVPSLNLETLLAPEASYRMLNLEAFPFILEVIFLVLEGYLLIM